MNTLMVFYVLIIALFALFLITLALMFVVGRLEEKLKVYENVLRNNGFKLEEEDGDSCDWDEG